MLLTIMFPLGLVLPLGLLFDEFLQTDVANAILTERTIVAFLTII